jgi:hypothetical protein
VPDKLKQDQLLEELEEDGDSFFLGGFWNNIIDLSLTIFTVLSSLVTAGLAVADSQKISHWLIATLAAVPAAAASIQKIVAVRDRSNWYFIYAAQVRSLATRLKFANVPNVEEIAIERAKLEVEMEEEWTKIGSSTGTTRRDRKNPAKKRNMKP